MILVGMILGKSQRASGSVRIISPVLFGAFGRFAPPSPWVHSLLLRGGKADLVHNRRGFEKEHSKNPLDFPGFKNDIPISHLQERH